MMSTKCKILNGIPKYFLTDKKKMSASIVNTLNA